MAPAKPLEIGNNSIGVQAAQYVRVSTDLQKYAIENQAAAIAAYAARRSINIVRTYSDLGRSGVKIAGRDALQQQYTTCSVGRRTSVASWSMTSADGAVSKTSTKALIMNLYADVPE
jgi:hypothetical protein